jgi:hypothetical protein
MKYVTKRGEFASLQLLRQAYLKSNDGAQFWLDPGAFEEHTPSGLLRATDVGKCPRAVAYRLLKTPKKPRSASAAANREVMMWAAYRFHFLTYSALNWAGILVEHEYEVPLPDGWIGRSDALIRNGDDLWRFDEKTVLPNALQNYRYDHPKAKDCLQLATYDLPEPLGRGLIEYTDRAGSNRPEECEIDLEKWGTKVPPLMVALEAMRDSLPELPPMLDPTYQAHYSKGQGGRMWLSTIDCVTPWDCSYCDYHLTRLESRTNPNSGRPRKYGWTQSESVCKPVNLPPQQVAEWKNGSLTNVRSGHAEALDAWIPSQITNYIPEEEE